MTNSTQFGNDSNCSKFNGKNIATNRSRVTVFALDGLTKKHFGHCAILKLFPSDHQVFGSARPGRDVKTRGKVNLYNVQAMSKVSYNIPSPQIFIDVLSVIHELILGENEIKMVIKITFLFS